MEPVNYQTLRSIMDQFPSYEELRGEIEELVAPRYGVISGFQEILEEIKVLQEIDLKEIDPL
ncbi:MAG TPA: hypothetical protein PLK59_09070 [Synergistales bacterium]|nr:hypothetical protein [Synergistales bacterium]